MTPAHASGSIVDHGRLPADIDGIGAAVFIRRCLSEICDINFLEDLIFPKDVIQPKEAPDSIKRLCDNRQYLKILIQG